MKKILIILSIVISNVCQSQTHSIPTSIMRSNLDILKNDTLKLFADLLNIDVNNYKILRLSDISDSTMVYDKRGVKYKIINSTITFNNPDCNSISQKVIKYNTHSKIRMGEKFLYCDITKVPDKNNNYYALFYVLE